MRHWHYAPVLRCSGCLHQDTQHPRAPAGGVLVEHVVVLPQDLEHPARVALRGRGRCAGAGETCRCNISRDEVAADPMPIEWHQGAPISFDSIRIVTQTWTTDTVHPAVELSDLKISVAQRQDEWLEISAFPERPTLPFVSAWSRLRTIDRYKIEIRDLEPGDVAVSIWPSETAFRRLGHFREPARLFGTVAEIKLSIHQVEDSAIDERMVAIDHDIQNAPSPAAETNMGLWMRVLFDERARREKVRARRA